MSTAEPRVDVIVCNGVDPQTGERCGRVYKNYGPWDAQTSARTAGWRIGLLLGGGLDAMCPRCARPDPELVKVCRDLRTAATQRGAA
jgi:hypothetical protein